MAGWTTRDVVEAHRRQGRPMPIQTACGDGRPNKYGATRVQLDGHVFASKAESRAYQVLKILEAAGQITELRLQPRYELQPGFRSGGKWVRSVTYVADFEFLRDGKRVAVDVKGAETAAFRIKAKLFTARYPEIALEIWK